VNWEVVSILFTPQHSYISYIFGPVIISLEWKKLKTGLQK